MYKNNINGQKTVLTLSNASIERGNDLDDIFFLDMLALFATSEFDRRRVVFGGLLCVCLFTSFL